ncbi:MAG: NAD-dependent epimerase/dehydratase family protein [Rhodobacteraceae bacterium]|nr:NAD-dependent epimerase/dehydratase family protein [Paracoccaceae bacterium]MCY4196009.1 NAD-dependent epimerase/dehydratase family protein [Paracoccaceae bacterium]MCY4327499.1 NAD-dependent epimerase/dehydratase family protein [Paracoccaceae bacterium]
MVKCLIAGGGGMIGQKLARHLDTYGLAGQGITTLELFDLSFPTNGAKIGTRTTGTMTDANSLSQLAAKKFDVIFFLAAVVSGEAEMDFEKGWEINLFCLWNFLNRLKSETETNGAYLPRLVFASTTGVFGPPFHGPVSDRQICEPRSSYGAQKVCAEMLVSDFSRKGFIDGVSIRLPTISVRPGAPNRAASSFFSSIIREPLNGRSTVLPVSRDLVHMHASPRSAAGFFAHAAELDTASLDGRRSLNMPSLTCSVEEQINALESVAGSEAVKFISEKPDPFVESIVSTWPCGFQADRAKELGFRSENSYEEIIQIYIDEDLPLDLTRPR